MHRNTTRIVIHRSQPNRSSIAFALTISTSTRDGRFQAETWVLDGRLGMSLMMSYFKLLYFAVVSYIFVTMDNVSTDIIFRRVPFVCVF